MESQLDDDKADLIFRYFETHGIDNVINLSSSENNYELIAISDTNSDFTTSNDSVSSYNSLSTRNSSAASFDYSFLLKPPLKSNYIQPIIKEIYVPNQRMLQFKGEGRIPFLMRFPQLWQLAVNEGDSKAQQILMNEVLTEDCIFQPTVKKIVTGKANVAAFMIFILKLMPDFYMTFSNIKHKERRVITFKQVCIGSIIPNPPESTNAPKGIFETLPIADMDAKMKLQKQKYDLLKSQNKIISVERKAFFSIRLNPELQYIEAIMTKGITFEVTESPVQLR